ncbi:helical backbone metal receptor [Streptomyces sp. NBC_01142]|uniref:helical backbone metal receptor n=1 Tax=Streptomyces sp. NBC_01142 TaxID=2975865 RepID=UPI002252EB89|nr:helical backbone metal receptor [Streptomyces sp. NBC_01142]MCX4821890.1 helical backbone metal receptor [Streptomyces sp. NBC_01142]
MRVVSLVPSLTEAVAVSAPGLLVGATDWCSHPADLDVVRIGGTKNPDVAAVIRLRPDLVIANEEENREPDLTALREAGVEVLVTEVRDLRQAFAELERVLVAGCGLARPRWLDEAEAAWAAVESGAVCGVVSGAGEASAAVSGVVPGAGEASGAVSGTAGAPRVAPTDGWRAIVPIWRRPWMVLGRNTFAGDLLARLGVENVYAGHAERYPRIPVDELRGCGAQLAVLPDEPYRFAADDGPEAFPELPAALVSGRHLTWYGPSLAEAPAVIGAALRAALR